MTEAPLSADATANSSPTVQASPAAENPTQVAPKWRPLSSIERRVAGVLVEKAKTTPDAYPMTLNAIVTGCNQKNNREPQMSVTPDAVESALESLRMSGAVAEIQGAGRVSKYRHFLYEWLGVDKFEIAVITELLLRGDQTIGELRGRAARMEAIAGLEELKPILKSLLAKNLIVSLTPEGRGQAVTHNLYKEREITEIKAHYANQANQPPASDGAAATGTPSPARSVVSRAAANNDAEIGELRRDFALLRDEVAELRAEIERLKG